MADEKSGPVEVSPVERMTRKQREVFKGAWETTRIQQGFQDTIERLGIGEEFVRDFLAARLSDQNPQTIFRELMTLAINFNLLTGSDRQPRDPKRVKTVQGRVLNALMEPVAKEK